jgi:flavin-dependent dehydrogenase
MWGLSRNVLDSILLDQARDAGASVVQPARFEGLDVHAVRVRDLESNEIRKLQADHVIIADGKPPKRRWRDFGIKVHFEGIRGPAGAIELFGCQGLYGGIAPIENNRWNLAFRVPAKRLREFNGDIDAMFGQIRNSNPALDGRLTGATRITRWLSAPLPRFRAPARADSNAIRVGNAAAALEPIGGEGMGLAMASAELAANALITNKVDLLDSQYKSLWRVRRSACRVAGMIVSRPRLMRPSMLLLRPSTPLPRFSLALIGK